MGQMTLILGGARSGKSSFAEALARDLGGQVVYLATAEALDEEMKARIAKHQGDRPQEWQTLEVPKDIARHWSEEQFESDVVILDCLTLLVNNLLMEAAPGGDNPDETAAKDLVESEVNALLDEIKQSAADWIIVSNEVGLGLVPPNPLGRIYRDLLGFTNQRFASQANQVYLMVAGIPVPIHQFRKPSP